ncbi:hypothetical protein [Streptomyces sp. NPDC005423]|uniref:hypothetical protein n=1 Tax=Streptomyces sp. NPDC005423 TaxID=3155343 RepID=UPI0033AAA1B7
MIQQRIVLLSVAGLTSAFFLAACGSSMDYTASGTSPGSVAPVSTAVSRPATSAPAATGDSGGARPGTTTGVRAVAVTGLGNVVTDDRGMTLYRYDKDEASPSKWTCSGACTKTWVPVVIGDSVRTTGVDEGLLGTVHRDGRKQLTLGGWPLYRYVGDTAAGQVNGQAKESLWYAVSPTGAKSTATS